LNYYLAMQGMSMQVLNGLKVAKPYLCNLIFLSMFALDSLLKKFKRS